MNKSNPLTKIVDNLTVESEKMIEQSPPLGAFQEEIDRRLSNATAQADRLEILNIMFKCFRNELHGELEYLNELLDLVDNNHGHIKSHASR